MRTTRVLTAALLLCACGAGPAAEDFPTFWTQFSDAVRNNNEADVRALTKFPFLFEGGEQPESDFAPIYAALFDEPARECIAAATPAEEDGRYSVFCGVIIYVFSNESGAWRFTEFAADAEAVEDARSDNGDGTTFRTALAAR